MKAPIIENISEPIKEGLVEARAMRHNLYATYTDFMNNKLGKNGGNRSKIDIDLLLAEVKIIEAHGKQVMMDIHANNLFRKVSQERLLSTN